MKSHRGTLILVLGVLSLVVCAPLGIVAWVMGNTDLREIAAGTMDPAGKDLTTIGRILGMIGTALLALAIIVFLIFAATGLAGAALSGGR